MCVESAAAAVPTRSRVQPVRLQKVVLPSTFVPGDFVERSSR